MNIIYLAASIFPIAHCGWFLCCFLSVGIKMVSGKGQYVNLTYNFPAVEMAFPLNWIKVGHLSTQNFAIHVNERQTHEILISKSLLNHESRLAMNFFNRIVSNNSWVHYTSYTKSIIKIFEHDIITISILRLVFFKLESFIIILIQV